MAHPKRGRPKVPATHRDDAVCDLQDGVEELAEFRALVLANRRREDRLLKHAVSKLISAGGAWRRSRRIELGQPAEEIGEPRVAA